MNNNNQKGTKINKKKESKKYTYTQLLEINKNKNSQSIVDLNQQQDTS